MSGEVLLRNYDKNGYKSGASKLKRFLWFYVNALFFKTSLVPSSFLKVFLLRLFGAKIGVSVVIRHGVNIKYPWLLSIGDFSWIGENVWIDNLVMVSIGSNVCISQGAMLLTGNHNYHSKNFDLITGKIDLKNGVWLGAKTIVCPNVCAAEHAVLTAGSIAIKNLENYGIYQGNPAVKVKTRSIST